MSSTAHAAGFGCCQSQDRAQALPTRHQAIAHRLVNGGGPRFGSRERSPQRRLHKKAPPIQIESQGLRTSGSAGCLWERHIVERRSLTNDFLKESYKTPRNDRGPA
jgi:hypothetical protein